MEVVALEHVVGNYLVKHLVLVFHQLVVEVDQLLILRVKERHR